MRTLTLAILLSASGAPAAEAPVAPAVERVPDAGDPKFLEKLSVMLSRVDKSVQLIRVQITQNQSAPFLANLYLQLGDLLSQKSNVLYYLQMEHDKNTDLKVQETKRFSPVVGAEQEAIGIYEQILKDFPKFDQLDKVLYRLAVAQKAIDEVAAFVATAERLIKAYPESHEAIQARLLLGQHFYEAQDYPQALGYLNAIKDCPSPYERGAARYRIGLIEISQEKHAEALKHFEQVATDQELHDLDNPASISLKTKAVGNNIKREALIDSVRAYTEVYKTHGDPVAYYAQIAPTEVLFQEVIEKLAYRYIFLKQYTAAIKLLRTLSERTADAQKIMNIYHEVLQMIPIKDRLDLPVAEMRFVLDKYNYWSTHYTLDPELKGKAYEFFETQVRELGTRSHDLAKKEIDRARKEELFERARGFYQLYLGYFKRDPRAVKMASNLADVYFNQSNYLESASYYMRVFAGEFGAATRKDVLIQNAILALQKPSEYAFYEQLRSKGLLVKAIRTYQAFDPRMKNDAALNFTLAKTYYEQGFYDRALQDLYGFMKKYPTSNDVPSAAELILNYYNTRSDFKGLVEWSGKMLALDPRQVALRERLTSVRSKAQLKRLDEQVKTQKGYDVFSQGKSYLKTALASGDASLRSAAFEQALGRSKSEKDIETFLKTALVMAKAETNPSKRADLLNAMADETLNISRFYLTLKIWQRILDDGAIDQKGKAAAFDKMVKLAVMLHDANELARLMTTPLAKSLPADTVKSVRQMIAGFIESPIVPPAAMVQYLTAHLESDDEALAVYKAQGRVGGAAVAQASARCTGSARSALCKWIAYPKIAQGVTNLGTKLSAMPATIASVEPSAGAMNQTLEELRALQGEGDPSLDILVALASATVFDTFAKFLGRTAQANPEVALILNAKAKESVDSAAKSRAQCRTIVASANLVAPVTRFCGETRLLTAAEALRWTSVRALPPSPASDPRQADLDQLEKTVFVSRKEAKPYLDLAQAYLEKSQWYSALATANYGVTQFPQDQEEFYAVLGCGAAGLGIVGEAQYYLAKASESNGLKARCLAQIRAQK